MAESDEAEETVDYYAVLNVRKEANENEIKAAYRRMCVLYHPDKHHDPAKKKIAVELFSKIQKAHEVIQKRRGIYDVYGQKGLDAGWEIIERQRTPGEIREEYERLDKEKERSGVYNRLLIQRVVFLSEWMQPICLIIMTGILSMKEFCQTLKSVQCRSRSQ
ncbi:DnaJ (Hsp40), sub C, member 11 [Desmophyllum pertusum]|uniref:DnaJ (Hsp40), sub C, member 11 n=1 Tax=Desmophyllum pertusum TaxID=174260 RepID=A0A9X0DCT8_9CNID|nr:DnaJ (Hsp40), sub C, member 11 [Desmophyllum pertusum]